MGLDHRAIELYADVALDDDVSLRSQARSSEMAEFTWAEGAREFAITISQHALRELVRQSTLMIAALERFARAEHDESNDVAEYLITQGEAVRALTDAELRARLAPRSP